MDDITMILDIIASLVLKKLKQDSVIEGEEQSSPLS
jgi:hypothetical protein